MGSPRRIQIRTVQTFTAAGSCIDRHFVCCPVHEHSTTLEACGACMHHVSGRPGDGSVLCGVAPDEVDVSGSMWRADRLRVHLLAEQALVSAAVTRDVTVVHAGDSLDSVGEMLVAQEIGGAPVVDEDGKPIGIVSKSDLVRDHLMLGGSRTAGHVMTAFVATVPETASLSEVAELMAASGIHRVIVVSATGAVAGIVSTLDLLRWMAKPAEKETIPPPLAAVRARIPAARASVASLMGPRVVCVQPGVSADQLEDILVNQQISGVPVVETHGVSVGVVSKTDLVNAQYDQHGRGLVLEPDGELDGFDGAGRTTVNDLMTRTAISVREHTSVLRAATLMVEQAIHRVPVLTEDGTVVGLLTALDVVRWLAARDVDVASSASEMPKGELRAVAGRSARVGDDNEERKN